MNIIASIALLAAVALPSQAPSPGAESRPASRPALPLADVAWIHGAEDGVKCTDPPIQVHWFDADTVVFRQGKHVHAEAPFSFLLFGSKRSILFDTGATADAAKFPIAATVRECIQKRKLAAAGAEPPLTVAHLHSHFDHIAADAQFGGDPAVTVVGLQPDEVARAFGLGSPAKPAAFDLGGRELMILPIPGHEPSSIAVYDPKTRWLLTGDTLYPGRIYVAEHDWGLLKSSVKLMADFARRRPVSAVVGTHIEMTQKPGVDFPGGARYQPAEHVLPLAVDQLYEMDRALDALGDVPKRDVHDDFIIVPLKPRK